MRLVNVRVFQKPFNAKFGTPNEKFLQDVSFSGKTTCEAFIKIRKWLRESMAFDGVASIDFVSNTDFEEFKEWDDTTPYSILSYKDFLKHSSGA